MSINPWALSIRDLSKTYTNQFTALKGISLDVAPGDFFALLGPNGAGKSTTISIVSSLVKKTTGTVSIFGCDIDKDFSLAKQNIGVVPQEFNFNLFEKVEDIVANQGGYYGMPKALAYQRAEKYLTRLGLWDKKNQQARTLSGGMKRRLMIARALVHEPRLLILDEPTAGVDIELRRSMWDFLKEINDQGTTIILTTHYLEEAEMLCRNIAIINQGEIVENTSMKTLLKQVDKETLVFDTRQIHPQLPQLPDYMLRVVDDYSFEVVIKKGQSLNPLFTACTAQNIEIISMRNKVNRLEELFVSLVQEHKKEQNHKDEASI
ncbi:MAG: hypothetical protein RL497_997 [Pseudomonadota bacterium]|jgi:ABC-2 type transport system ATP-binding protein